MTRYGYFLSSKEYEPASLIEQAKMAEQAGFEADDAKNLEPLLDDWHTRREVARRRMLDHLDSAAYHEFVQAFGDFLMTPGAGAREIPPGEPVPYNPLFIHAKH